MKRLACILFVVLALLVSGCAGDGSVSSEQAVKVQVEKFLLGIENQDVAAIGTLVADTVTVISESGIAETYARDDFIEEMRKLLDDLCADSDFSIHFGPVVVRTLTRDAAIVSVEMVKGDSYETWFFTLANSSGRWLISVWKMSDDEGAVIPSVKEVIVIGKIIDAHTLEPIEATVEAWQVEKRNRTAGTDNYWGIPNWKIPRVKTDNEGNFQLILRDYPELQTRQYYLVFGSQEPEYSHDGEYIDMDRVYDGQTINIGLISLRRRNFY